MARRPGVCSSPRSRSADPTRALRDRGRRDVILMMPGGSPRAVSARKSSTRAHAWSRANTWSK
eukprot:1946660-Lingulodinium_polyedra.AAC.1